MNGMNIIINRVIHIISNRIDINVINRIDCIERRTSNVKSEDGEHPTICGPENQWRVIVL